jgi:glycosyltransferase involved in cell wall biosynthesis
VTERSAQRPQVALILLNNTTLGGAERRFAQVVTHLHRRKVAVAFVINESLLAGLVRAGVLSAETSPDLVIKERVGKLIEALLGRGEGTAAGATRGVRWTLAFFLRKLDYLIGGLTLGWWLRHRRPEVMHLVLGGAYVALPAQLGGWAPPAVLSMVCPDLRESVGSGIGTHLYRAALRRARVVDALTESIRDMLVRQEGVPPARIRVSAGSVVDTERFHPEEPKRPWVVFVGRLIPEKNPGLFVEACALVRARVPDVRFFLLGDGELKADVTARLRARGLESCTQIGWSDRVEDVLAEALVFVSLQRLDNYPSQAVLEAMACGAAVVATDVGLTWKLVDESVGVRVQATPEAVAEAVTGLLADPPRTVAMGRRGRERVIQQHSIDAYLDYLENLYDLARRAEPAAAE